MDMAQAARPEQDRTVEGSAARPCRGPRAARHAAAFPAVSWDLPGEWPQRGAAGGDVPTAALPGPCRVLEAEPPPNLFRGWSRYSGVELVGVGGMGRIYRAHDPRSGRPVALKFLVDGRHHPEALREARLQARVRHPNVLPVLDVGSLHGYPWFAMPFLEARTLKSLRSELDLPRGVALMAEVARTVDSIHHHGVVHCDLNPRNLLLSGPAAGELRPWVIDFGIAQETARPVAADTTRVVGTPAYMAPEQALGRHHRIDHRTDVYALGATLYELTTGRRPFAAATCEAVLTKAIKEEPQPIHELNADVPDRLERIILRCLEKHQDDRYPDAGQLAAELEGCLGGC